MKNKNKIADLFKIALYFLAASMIAMTVIHVANYFLEPKEAQAVEPIKVETGCYQVADGYDCTSDATKAEILRLVKTVGITWYTDEDIQLQAIIDKYSSRYSYAQTNVIRTVVETALAETYDDLDYLMALIDCESKFKPSNVNSHGNTPAMSRDRGLLQFNSHWQKKVSDTCAFDVKCATETAISMLKAGQQHLWACDNIIK